LEFIRTIESARFVRVGELTVMSARHTRREAAQAIAGRPEEDREGEHFRLRHRDPDEALAMGEPWR
jgi:hypothetical protein